MTKCGYCHYCHQPFDLIDATPEQAAAIAEDAQRPEDYFFMPDHVDEKTGEQCRGVGKSPESLIDQEEAWVNDDISVSGDIDEGEDNGNYLEDGDITDEERRDSNRYGY